MQLDDAVLKAMAEHSHSLTSLNMSYSQVRNNIYKVQLLHTSCIGRKPFVSSKIILAMSLSDQTTTSRTSKM